MKFRKPEIFQWFQELEFHAGKFFQQRIWRIEYSIQFLFSFHKSFNNRRIQNITNLQRKNQKVQGFVPPTSNFVEFKN